MLSDRRSWPLHDNSQPSADTGATPGADWHSSGSLCPLERLAVVRRGYARLMRECAGRLERALSS